MPPRQARPVSVDEVNNIVTASTYLRVARELLKKAGARNAAAAVQRAIKSADGAERHARGVLSRPRKEAGA